MKIGRNDPCRCGSGKKYKKCCLNRYALNVRQNRGNVSDYPIHECLADVQLDSGYAICVVVRKQPNSKYAMGTYYVDIFCLGVKMTGVKSDVSQGEVEFEKSRFPSADFREADYEYVRSIILGGVDYAKKLGFDPDPDWERSRHVVEANRSYVPKLDFGRDGKPFYIHGPHDNPREVIRTLKKNVGKGNYRFMLRGDDGGLFEERSDEQFFGGNGGTGRGSISRGIGKAHLEGEKSNHSILEKFREYNTEEVPGDPEGFLKVYAGITGLMDSVVECCEDFPEFSGFVEKIREAEELYLPSFPPLSPVSKSYYSHWALYDRKFGKDGKTLAGVFMDCLKTVKADLDTSVVEHLAESRMGVYEVLETRKDAVLLQELVTEEEFWAVCFSGYAGFVGQLWYARRIPPFAGYENYCSVITTTPYVLLNDKNDWLRFFEERGVSKENPHGFMKHGPDEFFWNEFIFYGYCGFVDEAIFLSGIPEKTETLPISDDYKRTGEVGRRLGLEYSRSEGTRHWKLDDRSENFLGILE